MRSRVKTKYRKPFGLTKSTLCPTPHPGRQQPPSLYI